MRTALVVIVGTSLVIEDSVFEGLRVSHDTLLILANSTAMLRSTSFINNQSATYGAMRAIGMQKLTIGNSSFISNTGADTLHHNPFNTPVNAFCMLAITHVLQCLVSCFLNLLLVQCST